MYRLLPTILGGILIFFSASAQFESFNEIKENLFINRPNTGNPQIRKNSIESIDYQLFEDYSYMDTRAFFYTSAQKAIQEIKHEKVDSGARIWQIYNHGWVVKTPSITIGFDLYDFFSWKSSLFTNLSGLLDISFISHQHNDHFSNWLSELLIERGVPVIVPAEFNKDWSANAVRMETGDSIELSGLKVIAHYGHHSVPVRQYEVITRENIKILHTGDNQTSETLPQIDSINILLLNGWINESGQTSHIIGVRNAIDLLKPDLCLPGHILDVGHLGSQSVTYASMYKVNKIELASDYEVLAWGERYHYGVWNDTILPCDVTNLYHNVVEDTLFIKWDSPAIASDGDSASFYRIIHVGYKDIITTNNILKIHVNIMSDNNIFRVYAYDECGNQSNNYEELLVNATNIRCLLNGSGFSIYPNPMKEEAILRLHDPQDHAYNISIFDVSGKVCRSINNIITSEYIIRKGNMKKGIYFVELKNSRKRSYHSLIIQ